MSMQTEPNIKISTLVVASKSVKSCSRTYDPWLQTVDDTEQLVGVDQGLTSKNSKWEGEECNHN
jgi:hypothetical protein